jgi:hypothetical protein
MLSSKETMGVWFPVREANGSRGQNIPGGKAMQKLAILATGLVVLVGFTWTSVATAQVNSNNPTVRLVDNCDPATFNAAIGPGTCLPSPHRFDTTFAEFLGLLFSPLATNVIGHPAWNFSPGYISIPAGHTLRVKNAGGEGHTFTEVAAFGGGSFPSSTASEAQPAQCHWMQREPAWQGPQSWHRVMPYGLRGFPPECTSSSAVSTPGCAPSLMSSREDVGPRRR